ncbi:Prohibitin-2 [Zancudomyces culisetae]|uniref:Prohibitin-2 n=1 Tax=Zancudomyces culisetae TaxID=1213189 RepID=A0A1R1PN21_ZANCU|nr:Prohibitin-2 [Zancudomyces culisetae]|eukprot:OMH82331.1 Prohibitin-2 [Zancudomyces culisetae]
MVAAITQLVGAYASDFKGKDLDKAVAKEIPLDLKLRTSLCFLFTAFMIIFTLYRFKKLISSAEYTRYVGTMEDELFLDSSIQDPEPVDLPNRRDVSGVFRQIRSFVVIIIVSFTITLALFPTLTTQVRSVGGKFGIAHLLEWHFVFFNLGDYVGRVISIYTEKMAFLLAKLLNKIRNMIYKTIDAIQPDDSSHQLTMYSVLLLYICCYARLGFFPYLFNSNLMCRNDIPGATGATSSIVLGVESKHALLYTVFSRYADIFFLAAMFIFGATNGWLISSSVVIGPQKSQDPALAGSILSFCISSGLAIGAAMSFLLAIPRLKKTFSKIAADAARLVFLCFPQIAQFATPTFNNFGKFCQAKWSFGGTGPSGGTGAPKRIGGAGLLAIGAGLAFWAVNESLYNVEGGHRAIKYSRISGVGSTIYSEGTHLKIPWLETPIIYNVRAKPRSLQSLTGSKDALPQIYRTLGQDFDERVLPSIVNEVLKSVVAQFNASQLITQREKVSKLVRETLVKRALLFNIVLDDVSLTHITFSPEFTSAVEMKQIAQQDAQRAAFVVERATQEKRSTIIKAEGEAKSAQLIGDAIKSKPGFLELRRIETAREIANTLQASQNRLFLDSSSLMLDVTEKSVQNNSNK